MKMKKFWVVACLLMATLGAHAQFEKGKWVVNPALTGLEFSTSKLEDTRFGISAQGGAFVLDNVALMLTLGADWNKSVDIYTTGVGGRYYFDQSGVYLGGGLKMRRWDWDGGGDASDTAFSLEAGYAYFLSRTVTIEPSVYYDLSFKDGDYSKFGIKVGFGFYF